MGLAWGSMPSDGAVSGKAAGLGKSASALCGCPLPSLPTTAALAKLSCHSLGLKLRTFGRNQFPPLHEGPGVSLGQTENN